jgi:transposase
LEVSPGDADFTPKRDQLLRGETVSNVVLGGLELGCALNDPIECRPVDASG